MTFLIRFTRVRLPLAAVLVSAVALTSCADSEATNEQATSVDATTAELAPVGNDADTAVSIKVRQVEMSDEMATLRLVVANTTDEIITLQSDNDQMVLTSNAGQSVEAAKKDLAIPAYSASEVTVDFVGAFGEAESFSLQINREGYGDSEPEITVPNISAKDTVYAEGSSDTAALQDVVAQHPNGTHIVLRSISTTADGVAVSFLAINGSENAISLARNEPVNIRSANGSVIPAVLPTTNATLSIPAYGRLTGVLRFYGPVGVPGTMVSVGFNEKAANSNEFTASPTIVIPNIALPGGS